MPEVWREVYPLEGHIEISSHGRVRWRDGPVIEQSVTRAGYACFAATIAGVRVLAHTHVVVTYAFHGAPGEPPEGVPYWVVRHLDGHHSNNRADNLAWGTPAQNTQDNFDHGKLGGSAAAGAKLTDGEVAEIRRAYSAKEGGTVALAERYAVGPTQIANIVRGAHWVLPEGTTHATEIEGETWRPVVLPEARLFDYEVSDRGRVRRICDTGGFYLKRQRQAHPEARPSVQLSERGHGARGRVFTRYVDTLVAAAFEIEPPLVPPKGHTWVLDRHDGDLANCAAVNLKWRLIKGKRMRRHARLGARKPKKGDKLTEAKVAEIRSRLAQGVAGRVLAGEYDVTPGVISMIKNGRIWKTEAAGWRP